MDSMQDIISKLVKHFTLLDRVQTSKSDQQKVSTVRFLECGPTPMLEDHFGPQDDDDRRPIREDSATTISEHQE